MAAAALWAGINVLDKFLISSRLRNPRVMLIFTSLISAAAAAVLPFFVPIDYNNWVYGLAAVGSGALYIAMSLFYLEALRYEEVSRVIPLFYVAPIFTAILAAIFLQEFFSGRIYAGIVLIVAGAIMISLRGAGDFKLRRPFWLMMAAAGLVSVSNILMGYALSRFNAWNVFWYARLGEALFALPFIYLAGPDLRQSIRAYGKKMLPILSFNELADIAALLLYTAAAAIGYISLVNTLSSVQPVFVFLLIILVGRRWPSALNEELNWGIFGQKMAAIGLILAGAYLVT